MDNYSFWQDFFDTYQSVADWIKALWLVAPPTFILTLIWLLARTRNWRGPVEPDAVGRLIYSVYRDSDNRTHIISHFPELTERPTVLLLDPPAYDRDENGGRGQTADIGGRSDRL